MRVAEEAQLRQIVDNFTTPLDSDPAADGQPPQHLCYLKIEEVGCVNYLSSLE
jgi:hypothetical protein